MTAATFPSAYGVAVPMREGDAIFDGHGLAVLAGIHDRRQQEAFAAHVRKTGAPQSRDVERFGGLTVEHLELPRPSGSVDAQLHFVHGAGVLEAASMAAVFKDFPRWCDRAAGLIQIHDIVWPQLSGSISPAFRAQSLMMVVTSALQRLEETEIDCLEAAAWYALTVYPEWRAIGAQWLEPVKDTWGRDWIAERPAYRRLARYRMQADGDIPSWLSGSRPWG